MAEITEAKVLIVVASGFDQAGLQMALQELRKQGAAVTVAGPDRAPIRGWTGRRWGVSMTPDVGVGDINASDYHAVLLPGVLNADGLRRNRQVRRLLEHFVDGKKIIAALGDATWLLAEIEAAHGAAASCRVITCRSAAQWPDFIATVVATLVEALHTLHAPLPLSAAPATKWSRYLGLLSRSLPRPIDDRPPAIQAELLSP